MPANSASGHRSAYVDNVRWVLILLVLSMHAVDTYSPFGNWYYTDRRSMGLASVLAFGTWQSYLQAFFMGLLFFIAGCYTPGSLVRKGLRRYVQDRAVRLGIPVLLYMLIIGPITEYWVAHSWSATDSSFVREWWLHIADGEVWSENGPLWFCLALLIFCCVYALLTRNADRLPTLPSIPLRWLAAFALLMAAGEFTLRLALPPNAALLNMHLADFAQYTLMFCAGVYLGRRNGLAALDYRGGVRALVVVGTLGGIGWCLLLAYGGAMQGHTETYGGGWHWQSAAFALWESCTCVAFSWAMLAIFRRHFDHQGRFAAFMSANAFAVYVFHPPLLVGVARLMHALAQPPVLLALLLTLGAALASFAFASLVARRVPYLARVL